MRYFKLENSKGEIVDITTTSILFHDVGGLGYEEENDFIRVGSVWRLNSREYSQLPITGKICFTEHGDTSPYQKYSQFKTFVDYAPLILYYYPYGVDGKRYRKTVRVSNLAKTEINEYGVLDDDIEFMPYTPWYEVVTGETSEIDIDDRAWIWGDGDENPPLVFEPAEGQNARPAKFRGEFRALINLNSESDNGSPVKITMIGPATNPTWSQYVAGEYIASGGFDPSANFSLRSGEKLVIDNTTGDYSMTVEDSAGVKRSVYSLRSFDLACFFTLKQGMNTFAVTSADGQPVKTLIEGYIYYATV